MLTLKALTLLLIYLLNISQAECIYVPVLINIFRQKAHCGWVRICAGSDKSAAHRRVRMLQFRLTFRRIYAVPVLSDRFLISREAKRKHIGISNTKTYIFKYLRRVSPKKEKLYINTKVIFYTNALNESFGRVEQNSPVETRRIFTNF